MERDRRKPSVFFKTVDGTPRMTWEIMRGEIGLSIFGAAISTVPLVDERNFDILYAYKKEPGGNLLARCKAPSYKVLGDFFKYVDSRSDDNRLLAIRAKPLQVQYKQMYEFTCHDVFDATVKEVIIRIYDIRCVQSSIKHQYPGEIILNLSLEGDPEILRAKTVYVISELYFCKRMYFFVRIGEREIIANMAGRRVPIGFRSDKFRIHDNGTISYKGIAKPRLKSKDATWIALDGSVLRGIESDATMWFPHKSGTGARRGTYYSGPVSSRLIVPKLTSPHTNDPDSDLSRDHNRRSAIPRQIVIE